MKYPIWVMLLICLIATILIEVTFALIFKVRDKKDLVNVVLVNIFTNPIVSSVPFAVNIFYGLMERNIVLAILEVLTVIVEGFIYSKTLKYKKINPYLLSLLLNVCSYFIGNIINGVIY